MIVRIYTGQDGQTHFEDLPLPAEENHNVALQAGAASCSAVSLRTIGAIGTPRPGDNTFLFSRGRWRSGSAMAPRAVLDRVMWSSLTTSQARATRRARWEFRGSVLLCRWAPNEGPAPDPRMRTRVAPRHCVVLRRPEASWHKRGGAGWLPGAIPHPATPGRFGYTRGDCVCQSVNV